VSAMGSNYFRVFNMATGITITPNPNPNPNP